MQTSPQIWLPRSWYAANLSVFQAAAPDLILGEMLRRADREVVVEQRNAWLEQITFLHSVLPGLSGWIFLEYNIPRMGRRVDAIVLLDSVLWVLEFKTGEQKPQRADLDQVWDYALDLKNFHSASHNLAIVPVVIYPRNEGEGQVQFIADADDVYRPLILSAEHLRACLHWGVTARSAIAMTGPDWQGAAYQPTPTIIEAARALYARHSVVEIARSDAGARNLNITSQRVLDLVRQAAGQHQKIICFITGVPGAGKTLVGLNVATQPWDVGSAAHAVFLSGNGPLVAVLREALARDEWQRRKSCGDTVRKGHLRQKTQTFIQNVHHFRDEGLRDSRAPSEHVVIFDEAQRAWNLTQTAGFMRRRKHIPDFRQSEPHFLISCMDRHQDWAVIICLVGGGQEINTGEAGIQEWLRALADFPAWQVHVSSRLNQAEYDCHSALEPLQSAGRVRDDERLHLAVSMRSFRAEHVSEFVHCVLWNETAQARNMLAQLTHYPLVLSRDLPQARRWVRDQARGSERYGLLASSKAQRLKPHAIDIRVDIDPVHWFLNGREDTRSSFYLEDAATEFQVQGLELDWSCMTWDADLRYNGAGWDYRDFHGKRWKTIRHADNRRYLLNAYRVLLTRARQGMVIVVPRGDASDPTRLPELYDPTFEYLAGLGLPVLH